MSEPEINNRYDQEVYPVLVPEMLDASPSVWTAAIGDFRSHGGFRYYQHCMMHTLHFVTAGHGTFEYDGKAYPTGPGDISAFFPGQVIRYFDEEAQPWRYWWIRLNGPLTPWVMAQCGFTPEHPVCHVSSPALEAHVRHLLERAQGRIPPHFPMSWTWQLVELMARPVTGERSVDLAQACRSLIDDDFNQSVTVEELAERLGVDCATLFRHFREAYGISPKCYIDELRLRKAKALLEDTELPVKEISLLCGFNSPDYFVRRFRQSAGLPPGKWRQKG